VVVSAEIDLADVARFVPRVELVAGGATRHGSEWNALRALRGSVADADVIAIHDAARPLVAAGDVRAVFAAAAREGAAMLATAATLPALQIAGAVVTGALSPSTVRRAETPQAARAGSLFDAYERAAADDFTGTDTAAVLARYGYPVRVVAASAQNPKVTVPADLPRAEALLWSR